MKLDKLRTLLSELEGEFKPDGVTSVVYFFFEDSWNRLGDPTTLPESIVTSLDRAATDPVAYHPASSRTAWFACPSMNCCVSLEFATSPRLETRKRFKRRIEQVLTRASNAYQVAHNPLTLLLAKDAFRSRVKDAIADLESSEPPSPEIQGVDQQRILAVFALDIDYFKQVNDSHGHLYGDQVLKTFGIRLERASDEWTAGGRASTNVSIGHPSGEEFLVLAVGMATREELIELANFCRAKIDGEPLPSETEWTWLCARENLAMLVPPPLHERKITTSVGVAFYSPTMSGESVLDRVSRLLDQADTALYRAKAAGRNQVIAFDEILGSCGRVLEQDASTRIVAIDIGKNVGVSIGQEFRVYPPGFTGNRKFLISDGRSIRTVGTYPRFDLTRITVFNVQPEISFAFVSNQADSELPIEVGSHLEAIPLGSIGHLLPHASKYLSSGMDGVRVGDIESLKAFIDEASRSDVKPFAIVFRFARADQYLKQYGPAALNAALARLYRDATAAFHAAAATGVLDSGSVAIVGKNQSYDEARVTGLVDALGVELPELGLVAGAYCRADIPKKTAQGYAPLASQHAIEFARFAASDHALTSRSRVTHFGYETAVRILSTQREARLFSQAQADFEKFRALGLESPGLLNMGGLIAAALRKDEQAADLFEKAANLEPSSIIFRSNFATVAISAGQIERALVLLNSLSQEQVIELRKLHPFGYVSYARLLAKARLSQSGAFDAERFEQIGADALDLEGYAGSPASAVIRKALEAG